MVGEQRCNRRSSRQLAVEAVMVAFGDLVRKKLVLHVSHLVAGSTDVQGLMKQSAVASLCT